MQKDNGFFEKLFTTFLEEAAEHLEQITAGILKLEDAETADWEKVLEIVYRATHSLKGAARTVNIEEVESICQRMEDIFFSMKGGGRRLFSGGQADVLNEACDLIKRILADAGPKKQGGMSVPLHDLFRKLDRFEGPVLRAPGKTEEKETDPAPPVAVLQSEPSVENSVRISTAKLDSMLRQAEEMLSVKLRAEETAGSVVRLAAIVNTVKNRWVDIYSRIRTVFQNGETSPSYQADGGILDALTEGVSALQELNAKLESAGTRALDDSAVIGRLVDTLVEDSKKLSMQPFSYLFGVLPRAVRDLSRAKNKKVRLKLFGESIEVDKRILDEMRDPLIHMVSNAVDHGIESGPVRKKQGKPETGSITIGVEQHEGGRIELTVKDDGGGIDTEAVKKSAIEHSLVGDSDMRGLDPEGVLHLIFQSELSTARAVSETSGRGLGLAIVFAKVEALGGRVEVRSDKGRGTTFSIFLPVTLSASRVVLVGVGGLEFAVPTSQVMRVLLLGKDDIRTVGGRATVPYENRNVPLVRLGSLLDIPEEKPIEIERLTALILGFSGRVLAFEVDEIVGEQESLVKTMGTQIQRLRNFAGVTVLGTGRVVPILHVADLFASMHRAAEVLLPWKKPGTREGKKGPRTVLVVEDSITSRMLLKNILEMAGYQVWTAVNGRDAVEKLDSVGVDIVVSDIEMPGMDGIELTRVIRKSEKRSNLPVVLVTALASPEDRERGIEAGANAYIVKKSFDQSDLLNTVRKLL